MAVDPSAPLIGPGNLPYSVYATNSIDWHFPTQVSRPEDIAEVVKETEQDPTDETIVLPSLPEDIDVPVAPTSDSVTTEAVDGTGVFDIYMRAGTNQLMTQYDKGRIKGADFTGAYIQMMQLMMTQANQFVLGVFQGEVAALQAPYQAMTAQYQAAMVKYQATKTMADAKLVLTQIEELRANGAADRTVKKSQVSVQSQQSQLYERQIKGFDDKTRTDNFKIIMDAWSVQAVEVDTTGASLLNPLKPTNLGDSVLEIINDIGLPNSGTGGD